MIVSATGHRPDKLGGYNNPTSETKQIALVIAQLEVLKPSFAISGMALGFDTSFAKAAIELGIPLIAAIPFEGQERTWRNKTDIDTYNNLLQQANKIVVVTKGDFSTKPFGEVVAALHRRNEWMVDRSDLIVAMYNGDLKGGTANCVRYARKQSKRISNLWADFSNPPREP